MDVIKKKKKKGRRPKALKCKCLSGRLKKEKEDLTGKKIPRSHKARLLPSVR
jgi:hypothetical protein